ncbi:hypothetical protein PRK78_001205 [Emydomyces testavorans]|uniref:Uncharacterized protein n=1 Tax=Emydomyces testavorans TaxID=2070801 RepID=A0AAF0DCB3_9EURO|nr:hypothetical protein PRK78_001205 [Emydomyces testavorans]
MDSGQYSAENKELPPRTGTLSSSQERKSKHIDADSVSACPDGYLRLIESCMHIHESPKVESNRAQREISASLALVRA